MAETYTQAGVGEMAPGERTRGDRCMNCAQPGFEHEKVKVYPEGGPPGTYHYQYICPKDGGEADG